MDVGTLSFILCAVFAQFLNNLPHRMNVEALSFILCRDSNARHLLSRTQNDWEGCWNHSVALFCGINTIFVTQNG